MRDYKMEFVSAMYLLQRKGFDPNIIYAQSYLETGAFINPSCIPLLEVFNYWGLKFTPKHGAGGIEKETTEFVNGKLIKVVCKFQAFTQQHQAMAVYIGHIQHTYPNAYDNRTDPKKYYEGLCNGMYKWSTSPTYPADLLRTYNILKDKNELPL